jgi:hypothetical protein
MSDLLSTAAKTLLSPIVLFFALGWLAGRLKSDLAIPEAVGKGLALYLMLAIGFRGGHELAAASVGAAAVWGLLAALALSAALPFIAYGLLRLCAPVGRIDAGAIAAHYGSVSVVTFVAGTAFLASRGVAFEPHLVPMMVLMETPAIVAGLWLARGGRSTGGAPLRMGPVLRHAVTSGGVLLLLGSFAIGWGTGAEGWRTLAPVVDAPFKGLLCVFLLEMGLLTARKTGGARFHPGLVAFALCMPVVGAALGLGTAALLGLSVGGGTLLAVLAASASYIVVPAALRLTLPEANPALSLPIVLGVTFPFNLVVGIPAYHAAAAALLA